MSSDLFSTSPQTVFRFLVVFWPAEKNCIHVLENLCSAARRGIFCVSRIDFVFLNIHGKSLHIFQCISWDRSGCRSFVFTVLCFQGLSYLRLTITPCNPATSGIWHVNMCCIKLQLHRTSATMIQHGAEQRPPNRAPSLLRWRPLYHSLHRPT